MSGLYVWGWFAAWLSQFLGKRLLKTGLLDGFLIAKDPSI